MTDKVVRDGKVAVLYSPGYGAGWSTWNGCLGEEAVFCPDLVAAALGETGETQLAVIERVWANEEYVCTLGVPLSVEWVPQGYTFEISEYDGFEAVRIFDEMSGYVA